MDNYDAMMEMARRLRGQVVSMSHAAETPHLGSSLSCVDIVTAAYWSVLNIDPREPTAPQRDRFILSKGHAATTLYSALCFRGFYPREILDNYCHEGSPLAEHPGPQCVPGVEAATGSLGHGLPIGVGLALASRINKIPYRVFVLMSDGECNEGSVWEAAMMAPAQRLGNLCAIVDYNKWQATGRSNEILALSPLIDKWRAFGWQATEVDGHDIAALVQNMSAVKTGDGVPTAIIAHTVKGRGVSFIEDDNNWHYRVPTEDEVRKAHVELGLA